MKNFKRLVAGAIAATMALALSVSAFAEVEVKDAVKASYADGKAAYTETITAKDGTQMTVAIFKALDQNETLSAEKLEYINQDEEGVLNLSAMGTKNNLLAEDNEGNATYAGDYVIRVGYYDANNAWQVAEGSFTVATKAENNKTLTLKWGDIDCDTAANTADATAIITAYLGGTKEYNFTDSDGETYTFTWNSKNVTDSKGNNFTMANSWGDVDLDTVANTADATAIITAYLGGTDEFEGIIWGDAANITLTPANN